MKITRRQTLLGAVSLTVGLPIATHATPVHPLSPLFPMTQEQNPGLLRTRFTFTKSVGVTYPFDVAAYYAQNKAQHFNADLEVFPTSHGRPVASVFEAEDILLNMNMAPVTEYVLPPESEPSPCWHFVGDNIRPFIAINRQCNLISSRTYRAAGNVILMNESTFHRLMTFSSIDFEKYFVPSEREKIGRWIKYSIFNSIIPIYTSDHMPDMEVVAFYRGQISTIGDKIGFDAGAVLVDRGSEGLLLIDDVFRPDLKSHPHYATQHSISSAQSYFTRVRFVNHPDV